VIESSSRAGAVEAREGVRAQTVPSGRVYWGKMKRAGAVDQVSPVRLRPNRDESVTQRVWRLPSLVRYPNCMLHTSRAVILALSSTVGIVRWFVELSCMRVNDAVHTTELFAAWRTSRRFHAISGSARAEIRLAVKACSIVLFCASVSAAIVAREVCSALRHSSSDL